jgi:hypothetical protein
MSWAHKCDRCGRYHDGRLYEVAVKPMNYMTEEEEDFDLCPACKSEFDDFMNGVKPKDLLGRLKDLLK